MAAESRHVLLLLQTDYLNYILMDQAAAEARKQPAHACGERNVRETDEPGCGLRALIGQLQCGKKELQLQCGKKELQLHCGKKELKRT